MMPPRIVSMTAALGLFLLVLSGCASPGGTPAPDKVKAAVQSLGGNPDQLYQEEVVFKTLDVKSYDSQIIFLVPSKDGKLSRIVDAQGEIYRDYADFLRNNGFTG
jgi:hypothetical protein